MENWYLVYTNPNKETYVVQQLEDRGVEVFYPTLRFERGYNRGIRTEPYFPQYVFVKIDLASANAKDLRWLAGVRTIVHFDDHPAIVPQAIVELFRQQLAPFERTVLRKNEWLFKSGQRVLIDDGPFAGLEAVFQKGLKNSERVQVLLHVMGAWTRSEIDGRKIRPL